jgi:protein-tyrosine phosphatase
MYQIKGYPLWIGHAGDGRNFRAVFDKRIRVIVQLAIEEPALAAPRELVYLRFPLHDGKDNSLDLVRIAIGAVAELIRTRTPTLVCCGAGMSRSPVIVAAALATTDSADFDDYLRNVLEGRPADVSPTLLADVREIARQSPHRFGTLPPMPPSQP